MERGCHCNDFSRAKLLRRGIAEAGRGLPSIEPGMPLPAGTGLNWQSFLLRSAGLVLAVYGLDRVRPGLLEEGVAGAAAGKQPILVSVFLEGGADGLSMLYPSGDPLYRSLRPKLALDASAGPVFAEDDRLHWHPALKPLAGLHEQGKVTVLPAVGYTHADQSHFTSRHYWEVGATSTSLRTGWLGRYLDVVGTADNPLQGLSLDGQLSPSLASSRVPVAAIDAPASYDLWVANVWNEVETLMFYSLRALGAQADGASDPALRTAGAVAVQSDRLREQLAPFGNSSQPLPAGPVAYPGSGDEPFPKQLASLAQLIDAGLPLHCVALNAPGEYDTHAAQPDALTSGLTLTAASLAAFQRDLEARGLADRVLVHVWSEFGRRAKENGSQGTDHGAAGVGFLVGSRVGGKMVGEFPGLKSGLDKDGNLQATVDFRAVYCSLVEQWLGHDAGRIIPGASGFKRPQLIA